LRHQFAALAEVRSAMRLTVARKIAYEMRVKIKQPITTRIATTGRVKNLVSPDASSALSAEINIEESVVIISI
jgi:uncharacterized protein (DUF2252 family)